MAQFSNNLEYNYAEHFKKEIAGLFVPGNPILIDLKNVERASLSCVQILVAAARKAEKDGIKFVIEPSDAMSKILNDLGLENITAMEGNT